MKVEFRNQELDVQIREYDNNRPALQLFDETNFPFAIATVNLPEIDIPKGFVAIKNYSENVGMLEALKAAGIIREVHSYYPSGHVQIPICALSTEAYEEVYGIKPTEDEELIEQAQ